MPPIRGILFLVVTVDQLLEYINTDTLKIPRGVPTALVIKTLTKPSPLH